MNTVMAFFLDSGQCYPYILGSNNSGENNASILKKMD